MLFRWDYKDLITHGGMGKGDDHDSIKKSRYIYSLKHAASHTLGEPRLKVNENFALLLKSEFFLIFTALGAKLICYFSLLGEERL